MNDFTLLLLDVWREACRHSDIGEAAARTLPILGGRFPIGTLLVRRINLKRSSIETVAAEPAGTETAGLPARTECRSGELEALLRWSRPGTVARGRGAELARSLPGLLPAGSGGWALAGPLLREAEPAGFLVLLSEVPFTAGHEGLFRTLLDPFSAALENDRRLHELRTMREAAEADNRSLLTRLERQDISESIIGAETGLRQVVERLDLVGAADVPVLLLGETGSGKEVVARAIHIRSRRSSGPFLRVNCGAIPPELIDSHLFGHERGSFSGAESLRKGWFERADGGTLFLDEVGELPPAAQVRLLRILQDGTFERVGGQRQLRVDVRIVAATNRNLQEMIPLGLFREDLWYRIAVFPIVIPPLRDRKEDIPPLAAHFALRAARRLGSVSLAPSPRDLELLMAYSWPGNVRELAAVLERAVILGHGCRLEVAKALGLGQPPPAAARGETAVSPVSAYLPGGGPMLTLDEAMAAHIEEALARCRGKIEGRGGAAALLGVNPHTLRARMRRLRVDWQRFRPE